MFKNRTDAGKQLAHKLSKYKNAMNIIVIGLPRGGVVPAYEVAKHFNFPLDIIVSKKIGAPDNKEYAIGAINDDGDMILNNQEPIPEKYIKTEKKRLTKLIKKQERYLRNNKKKIELKGKTVLLIDDGIVTGYTIISAIKYLKNHQVSKIIVAAPVCPQETYSLLENIVDEFVCIFCPEFFGALGAYYENFEQVSDEETKKYLEKQQKEYDC